MDDAGNDQDDVEVAGQGKRGHADEARNSCRRQHRPKMGPAGKALRIALLVYGHVKEERENWRQGADEKDDDYRQDVEKQLLYSILPFGDACVCCG